MSSIKTVCNTDSLPVVGGSGGAILSQIEKYTPSIEMLIMAAIVAAIGAAVGYFVKLILDKLVCKVLRKDE